MAIDLDSPRWAELANAPEFPRLVPELIKSLAERPTEHDWAEVWEQVAHQWTLAPVAYAALPHLWRLAQVQGLSRQADFLLSIGRVVAPIEAIAPCPADLQAEFESTLAAARTEALEAAAGGEYSPEDYVCVLQGAAALDGRRGPGIQLWFSLQAGEPELECPGCEAYMLGTFDEERLCLQIMDERLKSISQAVRVVPRTSAPSPSPDDSDDFAWLAALCRRSGQSKVLAWISQLYGTTTCPSCNRPFVVMHEIERSHGLR